MWLRSHEVLVTRIGTYVTGPETTRVREQTQFRDTLMVESELGRIVLSSRQRSSEPVMNGFGNVSFIQYALLHSSSCYLSVVPVVTFSVNQIRYPQIKMRP